MALSRSVLGRVAPSSPCRSNASGHWRRISSRSRRNCESVPPGCPTAIERPSQLQQVGYPVVEVALWSLLVVDPFWWDIFGVAVGGHADCPVTAVDFGVVCRAEEGAVFV